MNYDNVAAPTGTVASVKIGDQTIAGDAPDAAKAIAAAIKAHGYPASADPNDINYVMTVILLTILVVYVTLVYGPIAAWLVELFPTRIRYSGLSLPYHIGNGWFGGFLPATVFAIVAATGNIYSGLWYPIAVAAMSFVVGLIFLPETKDRDISRSSARVVAGSSRLSAAVQMKLTSGTAAMPSRFLSAALDVELHVDIVACGVRVRADLLVRLLGERRQFRLRHALILDVQLDREPEAAAVARPDRYVGGDARLAGVLLVLLADEVERAAKARGIAGGEQMLGRRRARLAGSAHCFRHRKIGVNQGRFGLGMSVAAADRGRGGGEKRLDRVHDDRLLL